MKQTAILIIAALVACVVFIVTLGNGPLVEALTPTAASASSSTYTITPTPTATPSPVTLGYDQALTTYKEISTEVIKSAERVLDITKWIVAGIFSLIGVAGGAILYISQAARQAKDSAARSATSAEDSRIRLENMEKQIQESLAQFQVFRKELENLKGQAKSSKRDVERVILQIETLANVATYGVRIFSADRHTNQIAKRTLIELSKDDNPVVRRECVRVFGTMPDYPECFVDIQDPLIISQLQEMALNDRERGVQLEARRTLKKFGVDLTGGE
jgi:hypothetical protein